MWVFYFPKIYRCDIGRREIDFNPCHSDDMVTCFIPRPTEKSVRMYKKRFFSYIKIKKKQFDLASDFESKDGIFLSNAVSWRLIGILYYA